MEFPLYVARDKLFCAASGAGDALVPASRHPLRRLYYLKSCYIIVQYSIVYHIIVCTYIYIYIYIYNTLYYSKL